MKKAELTKLRAKTIKELEKIVAEKNVSEKSKNIRRDIAQILTVVKEIKINENSKR